MKRYDFDEVLDRRGTDCVKHDGMKPYFGSDELLPMWVADMDFRSPDFVMEAIRNRCSHEVLGYARPSDSYYDTMLRWLRNHYRIEAAREEVHYIPGIVAGIAFVIQSLTRPGDKILVMNPVYPPFLNLPQSGGRELVCSCLKVEEGRFAIDFDDLDAKAEGCRLMILSNPHNPGGTVWSPSDLARIAEICSRRNVIVIADEIHADLTLPGHTHTSFSTVSRAAREISLTFIAPSKTFNIAGLASSLCYVPDPDLRSRLYGYLDGYELANGSVFAFVGAEAAFSQGEEWLGQLLAYLQGNADLMKDFLRSEMPEVHAVMPEASFLPWLDFGPYGLAREVLVQKIYGEAKVALNDGITFGGSRYGCCFRMNIGCPRSVLLHALDLLKNAFQNR